MNRRFKNADGLAWNDFSDDEVKLHAVCCAGSLKHASRTGRKAGPRSPKKSEDLFLNRKSAGNDFPGNPRERDRRVF